MTVTLAYDAGTIELTSDRESDPALADLPDVSYDPRSETARAPAVDYAAIRDVLRRRGADVDDRVFEPASVSLSTSYELRAYQRDALEAWLDATCRGVLELPTGAGKTVIAIAAMARLSLPTLVVVPTIDLLEQWQAELEAEFDVPIGRLGGGEQRVESVTVATYDSAYLRADELGDRFRFVVFDEVHHLGAAGYQDIARLLAAPDRLGLTATFERPDGAHEAIAELVGPRVYDIAVDDLAGEHLAPYDIRRIEVELTPAERAAYDDAQGTFVDYVRSSNISFSSGSDYQQLVKRSGTDPAAREALLAKQRARELMMNAEHSPTCSTATARTASSCSPPTPTSSTGSPSGFSCRRSPVKQGRASAGRSSNASARGPTAGSSPRTCSTRASTFPTPTSRSSSRAVGANASSPSGWAGSSARRSTTAGPCSTNW